MAEEVKFLQTPRREPAARPVEERIGDYGLIAGELSRADLIDQACRCLDCGIPFCHDFGCPLQNRIPDFNELLCRGRWEEALRLLHSTNNFPELTGHLCPAPCEAACTLARDFGSVGIRQIELQLVEKGWREGWIRPAVRPPARGRRTAIIGSGPAGLAAAQELARKGYDVVVFERDRRPGGLLRYGIPDFKLDKDILDRRLEQLAAEGVSFETGVSAGIDLSGRYLLRSFDAVILAAGCRQPRKAVPGDTSPEGVHFALDYLSAQNRVNSGEWEELPPELSASGRRVLVIGGGDTGSDCIGTSRRQGARGVVQIEIMPRPPEERRPDNPWPTWPDIFRSSTSQQEGCERIWSVRVEELIGGASGRVEKTVCVRLDWSDPAGVPRTISGSRFELPVEMVIIAAGFTRTEPGPLLDQLGLDTARKGVIPVDGDYCTARAGVFAVGDCVRGASLIVNAIDQGRRCAAAVDAFLKGEPAEIRRA